MARRDATSPQTAGEDCLCPMSLGSTRQCVALKDTLLLANVQTLHAMIFDRRGFEVLLRKVLNYKSAPAVVILHWWSPVTQVCQHAVPEGHCHQLYRLGHAVQLLCCRPR